MKHLFILLFLVGCSTKPIRTIRVSVPPPLPPASIPAKARIQTGSLPAKPNLLLTWTENPQSVLNTYYVMRKDSLRGAWYLLGQTQSLQYQFPNTNSLGFLAVVASNSYTHKIAPASLP